MNDYKLGNLLSPLRFEQISRDLLKNQYGIFENFAEGRDGGIDFRYSQNNGNILIVQCKRYNNTHSLITTLKKESKKIQSLNFTDYLLVVSIDLSPESKDKIIEIFNGRIKNANQIITNSDLNYLLSQHQDIEFKYPELWINSINIHQKIFHLGFLKHADFIKEKLKKTLKVFVPYKEYYEIIKHFQDNNVIIISGNPGAGKTTLAHAIISNFVYLKDYKLIDISYRKIQEAESYIDSTEPTIFFIDDFLGKIKLDKDNDFAQLLLSFIQKIELSDNKKLVITSREYILKKAQKDLFSIEEINQTIPKYAIELTSFTRRIRTEILYAHIKNSQLGVEYIDNLLQNDFRKIIDHPNYNPRTIEQLANPQLLKNILPQQYFSFFIKNLETPSNIWNHVYDNLPNDLYKLILFVRFLINEPLSIENLEKAVMNIIEKSANFQRYSFDEFEYAIREMEGTFFRFEPGEDEILAEKYTIVEFQNPSIIDFIDSIIWKKTAWLDLIIKNAIFFEQLFNWELLEVLQSNEALRKSFTEKILHNFNTLENASFGCFDYSTEEASFTCAKYSRYNYYLSQFMDMFLTNEYVIDMNKDKEIAFFLHEEIFRYQLDETDDMSEKISYSKIAVVLLKIGLIESEEAINHYIPGITNNIKELVHLEYMTRVCSNQSLNFIKNNKQLKKIADNIFLTEIKTLQEKDFMDLIDFFDDYEQVKKNLPLNKSTKKLETIYPDISWENAMIKLRAATTSKKNLSKDSQEYYDISDSEINERLKNIKR